MYRLNPFSINGPQLVKDYNEFTGEDHTLAVRAYKPEDYTDDKAHIHYLTRDAKMGFADSISRLGEVDEKLVLIVGDALGTVAQGMRDSNDITLLRDKVIDPKFAEQRAGVKTITKYKGKFDVVVILDEFGKLEDAQLDSEIRRISNTVKPGGVVYFNVHNKSHHAPNWNEHPDLPNRLKAQGLEMTHFGGSELSIAMRKP
jgi:SAM-dependent methyltransferase